MSKNQLVLDYRDNPELQEALQGKQPGDEVTLEFDLMVTDNTDETFTADIDAVGLESPDDESAEEADGDEDKEVKPTADQPVMVVMVSKRAGAGNPTSPSGKSSGGQATSADS